MTSIVFASLASSSDIDMSSMAGAPALSKGVNLLKACIDPEHVNTLSTAALEPHAMLLQSHIMTCFMTHQASFTH